jgi:hypothetical protein
VEENAGVQQVAHGFDHREGGHEARVNVKCFVVSRHQGQIAQQMDDQKAAQEESGKGHPVFSGQRTAKKAFSSCHGVLFKGSLVCKSKVQTNPLFVF